MSKANLLVTIMLIVSMFILFFSSQYAIHINRKSIKGIQHLMDRQMEFNFKVAEDLNKIKANDTTLWKVQEPTDKWGKLGEVLGEILRNKKEE